MRKNFNYIQPENNYINVERIEKETSLHDYVNYGYEGLGEIYTSEDLPKEIYTFVREQFDRFNIRTPTDSILKDAIWDAVVCMNNWDPYSFFMGHTDVVVTGEWQTHTYELNHDGRPVELEPENLDTYKLVPDNDTRFFEYAYNNPGLEALSEQVIVDDALMFDGFHAADLLNDGINGQSIFDNDSFERASAEDQNWLIANSPDFKEVPHDRFMFEKYKPQVWEEDFDGGEWKEAEIGLKLYIYLKEGGECKTKWNVDLMKNKEFVEHFEAELYNFKCYNTRLDYFRLAGWAAMIWMLSPMARKWRSQYFNIFSACYTNNAGECIMYHGTVYEKMHYNKIERPPKSCYVCGLSSWCVDVTMLEGTVRCLCEKHVNGHIPVKPPVNCGTRSCRFVECPHHMYHGKKDGKALVYRDVGMLSTRARVSQALLEASGHQNQKLLN